MTTELRGSVEFFTVGDQEGVQCGRCGSSIDFDVCEHCGGDGFVEDESDDSWAYVEPDLVQCDDCQGKGGWWRCLSSAEFCQSHPLPGRENVRRPS